MFEARVVELAGQAEALAKVASLGRVGVDAEDSGTSHLGPIWSDGVFVGLVGASESAKRLKRLMSRTMTTRNNRRPANSPLPDAQPAPGCDV